MIKISVLPIENIEEDWDYVSPFIERALEYSLGEYDINDIYKDVLSGHTIVMAVTEDGDILSVLTLEIVDKPQKKIVNVLTAGGGNMEEWIEPVVNAVDKLAKEVGADLISIHGRSGWTRTLKNYNYNHSYTVVTKEIL